MIPSSLYVHRDEVVPSTTRRTEQKVSEHGGITNVYGQTRIRGHAAQKGFYALRKDVGIVEGLEQVHVTEIAPVARGAFEGWIHLSNQ